MDATLVSLSCPNSDPSQDTVLNWILLLTAPQSRIQILCETQEAVHRVNTKTDNLKFEKEI